MKFKHSFIHMGNLIIFLFAITITILKIIKVIDIELSFYVSAVLLLMIIVNISSLKEFSILGNTVKLKETIEDAKSILKQLKQFSRLTGELNVHTISWMNRYGTNEVLKNKFIHELIKYLEEIGFDKNEIKKITELYFNFTKYDYSSTLWGLINKFGLMTIGYQQDIKEKIKNDGTFNHPYTPDDLEVIANILGFHTSVNDNNSTLLKNGINDYKEFLKTGIIYPNSFWDELHNLPYGKYE